MGKGREPEHCETRFPIKTRGSRDQQLRVERDNDDKSRYVSVAAAGDFPRSAGTRPRLTPLCELRRQTLV